MKKIFEKAKTNSYLIFTILAVLIIIVTFLLIITKIFFDLNPIIICIITALFFASLIYVIAEY